MTESAVCTNSHRSYVPLRSDGTPHPTRSHQGARQNIRPSGNVDSTPGLDPRVQCVQLSFCSRWMHSFTPTSLHDRNISHYREVIARHGTQQYSWLCCTMRVRMTTTPAHTPGIPSPPPSGSSLLRGPARLSLAMVPSPSSKAEVITAATVLPEESGGSRARGRTATAERGGGKCSHRKRQTTSRTFPAFAALGWHRPSQDERQGRRGKAVSAPRSVHWCWSW